MKRKNIIGLIVGLLITTTLSAQLQEKTYVFKLHGQTRRYTMKMENKKDTLCLVWSILRNGELQKGRFKMCPESVENASSFSWIQPENGQSVILPAHETFGIISHQAYRSLDGKGFFIYNGVTYHRVDTDSSKRKIHVQADVDDTQMWIILSNDLPVVSEIKDNPLEIDWKIENE